MRSVSNGIKIAIFSKKLQKNILTGNWRFRTQITACDTFDLHKFVQYVSQFLHLHFFFGGGLSPLSLAKFWLLADTQAMVSDLPIYNIFVPQKFLFRKIVMTSLHDL